MGEVDVFDHFFSPSEDASYEWWQYFIIPWIAAIVGYGTNVVALVMTFYPIEYRGVNWYRYKDEPWGLFGWQGIIPSKAEKMASISFELFTKKLFDMKAIFYRLDPQKFSEVMSDSVLLMMDAIISEVAMQYMPSAWERLPQAVKDDIIVTADQEGEQFMADFMKDMQDHIEDVCDIKHMTVAACVANRQLIVNVFQECGEKEFTFIRQSGFYFGFILGLFQMSIWFFYDAPWTMPTAGFVVGYLTNYIALKVIFSPLQPRMFCGYTIQGLFLQRQKEGKLETTWLARQVERLLTSVWLSLGHFCTNGDV
jgi:uncharacterized membrane protein YheB (UPF0754 family)